MCDIGPTRVGYGCRQSSKIHGTIVWAWPGAVRVVLEHRGCVFHHCSSLAAREPDLDTIVGRVRLMRTTMRKEAQLECDAIARTFDAGLEKLLTELFVGTNSSSFATAFAHPPPNFNVRVGTTDNPFPTIASAVQDAVSLEEEERQKVCNVVESCFLNLCCHQFLQVRQFAMDLQVQVFERLATHASRMCAH